VREIVRAGECPGGNISVGEISRGKCPILAMSYPTTSANRTARYKLAKHTMGVFHWRPACSMERALCLYAWHHECAFMSTAFYFPSWRVGWQRVETEGRPERLWHVDYTNLENKKNKQAYKQIENEGGAKILRSSKFAPSEGICEFLLVTNRLTLYLKKKNPERYD